MKGRGRGSCRHAVSIAVIAALAAAALTGAAAQESTAPAHASAAPGKAQGSVPRAATLCVSCHGQDGVAIAPMYPSLAGQHEDYLVRALEEYRKGGRNNPVMKGFVATLKDEDIHVIAQYFSHLKPSLSTESRPYTWLTVR